MENFLSCFSLAQCYVTINSAMTLYFSAVWTQSGESGNTLKIKCSGTADERANIFAVPTTTEAECSSQCSVSDIMPYSY